MEERLPAFPTVSLRNALEESRGTHTISSAPRPDERHGPDSHVELARVIVRLRDTVRDPEREPAGVLVLRGLWAPLLEQLIRARVQLSAGMSLHFKLFIRMHILLRTSSTIVR